MTPAISGAKSHASIEVAANVSQATALTTVNTSHSSNSVLHSDDAHLAEVSAVVDSPMVSQAADEPGLSPASTALGKADGQSNAVPRIIAHTSEVQQEGSHVGTAISPPSASGVSNAGPTTVANQGQSHVPAAGDVSTPQRSLPPLKDFATATANVTGDAAAAKGFGNGAASNNPAPFSALDALERDPATSSAPEMLMSPTEAEVPALNPQLAGFLQTPPFANLGSFDVAMRQFLDELDESVEQAVDVRANAGLAPWVLAVVFSGAAVEVARRKLRLMPGEVALDFNCRFRVDELRLRS